MLEKTINLNDSPGLHLRAAAEIASITKSGSSRVTVSCENCGKNTADGCSIIQMLMLGVPRGQNIHLTVEGCDERLVLSRIEEFFSNGGGI